MTPQPAISPSPAPPTSWRSRPAAVGQQIRALEDVLGVVLFRRLPGGLELTPEGQAGLDALRDGFLQFEESVRAMRGGQGSNTLTIAAPRDATARWLLPRLAEYAKEAPEVRFRLESHRPHAGFHGGQSRPGARLGAGG